MVWHLGGATVPKLETRARESAAVLAVRSRGKSIKYYFVIGAVAHRRDTVPNRFNALFVNSVPSTVRYRTVPDSDRTQNLFRAIPYIEAP